MKAKHKYRRFICPNNQCRQECVSKFSLQRHHLRKQPRAELGNAFEFETYVLDNDAVVTERALITKIKRLEKLNTKLTKDKEAMMQKLRGRFPAKK